MNCFQFVIWRSLTHRVRKSRENVTCCELLSICDLTIFDTPVLVVTSTPRRLWIAFNLWFDDLWHTVAADFCWRHYVVNCFQFVIWRSLTHQQWILPCSPAGCELLSICDLTIFDTPLWYLSHLAAQLWIAFNLWFDDLWHTDDCTITGDDAVVNCFQFVIWRSLTHPSQKKETTSQSCELLSICDLTIFDTPHDHIWGIFRPLWIAFNLWFDDLWHTNHAKRVITAIVVNCFQFVIWRSLTHPLWIITEYPRRCELLSICDLTIFDTPAVKSFIRLGQLWIAFNLWFDDLWHTSVLRQLYAGLVVNCFQFVIWRSLTHHSWDDWAVA